MWFGVGQPPSYTTYPRSRDCTGRKEAELCNIVITWSAAINFLSCHFYCFPLLSSTFSSSGMSAGNTNWFQRNICFKLHLASSFFSLCTALFSQKSSTCFCVIGSTSNISFWECIDQRSTSSMWRPKINSKLKCWRLLKSWEEKSLKISRKTEFFQRPTSTKNDT